MSDVGDSVGKRIREAWNQDNPAGWFEPLYAAAQRGETEIPWAFMQPNPQMMAWLDSKSIDGEGKSALVIGCGLGDDAQALARRGFKVTAFDVSETAISWAKGRFVEDEPVEYVAVDLFNTPDEWTGAFDLVVEVHTIQSLPYTMVEDVIAKIASFVKPAGTLWVMCLGREPEQPRRGIPWALSRNELDEFINAGLREVTFDEWLFDDVKRFCVEYIRPINGE